MNMSKPLFFWGNDTLNDSRILVLTILFGWVRDTIVLLGGWFVFMGLQMTMVGWGIYASIYERGLRWKKEFEDRL